jgi:hypothetical protein
MPYAVFVEVGDRAVMVDRRARLVLKDLRALPCAHHRRPLLTRRSPVELEVAVHELQRHSRHLCVVGHDEKIERCANLHA